MAFDFSTLEPQIYQILSAPGTDLTTISAKRVRRQLVELEPSLTSEYLKENKDQVDAVIASVFEQVSAAQQAGGSQASEELPLVNNAESRKRKQNDNDSGDVKEEEDGDEEVETPPPKKAKKAGKNGREISDAELARKLSSEINSRSRRTADKPRRATNVAAKKGSKARKSAATVDSDDDSDDGGSKKKAKPKKRNTDGSGGAKGGFAKEYDLRYSSTLYDFQLKLTSHSLISPLQ